ncbi:hypothetical protein QUF80_14800 [Desulfococcaceae bacterium HSG8]|nr:hypothetical protein [Desulfococcaceae bacterium HSG8]
MPIPREHHSKTARLGTACCSVRIDKSEPCKVRGFANPREHHSKTARLGPACCSVRIDKSEQCEVRGFVNPQRAS